MPPRTTVLLKEFSAGGWRENFQMSCRLCGDVGDAGGNSAVCRKTAVKHQFSECARNAPET